MKNRFTPILCAFAIMSNVACSQENNQSVANQASINNEKMKNLYDFKVKDNAGKEFDLASLKGKKVMIVNVASECGLTPQYENLERIYKQYSSLGFEIIAFPCNDFGKQEPGSNEEIAQFCKKNYGVSFKIMDKVVVLGEEKCELYKWLTEKNLNGVEESEVIWNFQKYLIDENGNFVKMIHPKVLPDDKQITDWITGKN